MTRPFGLPEKRLIILPDERPREEAEPRADAVASREVVDDTCTCVACRIVAGRPVRTRASRADERRFAWIRQNGDDSGWDI